MASWALVRATKRRETLLLETARSRVSAGSGSSARRYLRVVTLAQRRLEQLAAGLERTHPGAAASLREGLDEVLTLQRLGITGALYRTLRSTNAIENLNGGVGHFARHVRRWRDGRMLVRWIATALQEVQQGFRRVSGYRDLRTLLRALDRLTMDNRKEVA